MASLVRRSSLLWLLALWTPFRYRGNNVSLSPGLQHQRRGTSEPGAEAFLSLSNDWILITSKGEYLVDLMSDTAYLVYNKPFRVSGSKLVVVRPPPFEVVRYGVVPYEVTHPFKQDKTGFEFQSASGQVITVKCPESAMAPPAYDGFDIERFIKGLVP
ncbi:MAG: hypothetical protein K1X67_22345 [Fimbriimonadaceae bacterium]|nr:hypothetical protein [Fimbriimonadaceae bacterium]